MHLSEQILVPLALVTGGMAAGGLMISVLGGAPLLLYLPTERYVPVHQFLVKRFDPFMPICLLLSLAADVVLLGAATGSGARGLATAACVCYLAAVTVALTKNVPINKWVYRLDPDHLPANWSDIDPRVRWRNWNLVRTCLAVLGLLANAGIAAVLI